MDVLFVVMFALCLFVGVVMSTSLLIWLIVLL